MDHFGIDLHQKHSEICGLDGEGGVNYQKRVTTSEASFRRVFGKRKASRVVIESGCQTAWAARLLQEMGHEVVVVNPRRVRLIARTRSCPNDVPSEGLRVLVPLVHAAVDQDAALPLVEPGGAAGDDPAGALKGGGGHGGGS